MNIPNILTVARIFLTFIFVWMMQVPTLSGAFTAFGLFITACITDFADGFIARKYGLITPFGKIMDPIADKVLTLSALSVLSFDGMIPLGLVIVVAVREVAVTAVRLLALGTGLVLPAETSGKVKTVFQMAAIILALMTYCAAFWAPTAEWSAKFHFLLAVLINSVMMIATFLTAWSGVIFFRGLKDRQTGPGE